MEILPITSDNIEVAWHLYQRSVAECDRLALEWFRFKVLDDPDRDADLRLIAVEDDVPMSFMDAGCREESGGLIGYIKAWGTDPQSRGMKLASALLSRVEERFKARGVSQVRAGQAKPHYYTPGIDPVAYTEGIAFLLRRGFSYQSMSYNMDVPLDGPSFTDAALDERLEGQGITLRRVAVGERDDFMRQVRDAGWGYSWEYQAGTSADADPPAAFIAERDGRMLGFAVYDAVRPSWFGPTGTSEEARGTGIGSALFLRCLDDMRDRGYSTCHICSVGPLYFYARVANATVSRTFWHLRKDM